MNTGYQALRALPSTDLAFVVGIPALWVVGFVAFVIYCLIWGMPRSPRFDKLGRSRVVPRLFLEYGHFVLNAQVTFFMKVGITADMMTLLSLFLAIGGGVYLGMGRFCLGGWLMFLSFFCDAYDGMIARRSGTASMRGEYFDAFIDRYADLATGFGFAYYYKDDPIPLLIVALGIVGSGAMGYARAKGEAVGVDPNVGVMQRHERAVWIGVMTVFAPIAAPFMEPGVTHPRYYLSLFALTLVAIFTNYSAIWRALYVMKRLPRTQLEVVAKIVVPVEEAITAGSDSQNGHQNGHQTGHHGDQVSGTHKNGTTAS